MKAYKQNRVQSTSIKRNESFEGESIEEKINRIVNNGEAIKDGAPIIYTERKDGVRAEMNPRTDRFEVALDAMTTVAKSKTAMRQKRIEEKEAKIVKLDSGAEPTQGKTSTTD